MRSISFVSLGQSRDSQDSQSKDWILFLSYLVILSCHPFRPSEQSAAPWPLGRPSSFHQPGSYPDPATRKWKKWKKTDIWCDLTNVQQYQTITASQLNVFTNNWHVFLSTSIWTLWNLFCCKLSWLETGLKHNLKTEMNRFFRVLFIFSCLNHCTGHRLHSISTWRHVATVPGCQVATARLHTAPLEMALARAALWYNSDIFWYSKINKSS